MAKVVCESCGTSFLYNVVKDMEICPVCGKPLWSQEDKDVISHDEKPSFGEDVVLGENDSFDEDKIDFWWYSIREPGTLDISDMGGLGITCTTCGHLSGTSYPISKTGNFLLLDPRGYAKCSNCKKELKNHILSKRPESWVDPRKRDMWVKDYENIPKCPTCSSTKIRKISATSKAASVAMWGVLSRKVHKQWHCDTCGSEW